MHSAGLDCWFKGYKARFLGDIVLSFRSRGNSIDGAEYKKCTNIKGRMSGHEIKPQIKENLLPV